MAKNDESLYLDATNEFESDDRDPALWAKCMSVCEGNEQKAKYKYINERVKSLSRSIKEQVNQNAQSAREGKGFFENLSSGNYGLAKTYWIYGVIVGFILGVPFRFITSIAAIYVYFALVTGYQMAVFPGIWHSADEYKGPKIWSVLAKLAVVIGMLILIVSWVLLISS